MANMTPKKKMTLAEKKKILGTVIEDINTKAKSKVIGFACDEDIKEKLRIKYLPFASLNLNFAIGGGEKIAGLPYGKISVIEGESDSGKTSCLLEAIGLEMSTNPDFTVAWVESEESISEDHLTMFNIDPDRFILIPVERKGAAESAINSLETIISSGAINFAFINSLKCLTPGEEFIKTMEQSTIGLQARFVSKMLRKLTAVLATEEVGLCIVNHLTTQIGMMFGDPLVSACGRAIKYSSMLTLDFRKRSIQDSDPINRDEGLKVGVTIKKNHCCVTTNPYLKTDYYILFGAGTDVMSEILENCCNQGILIKSGAWIREPDAIDPMQPRQLSDGTPLKWQGKDKFRSFLMDNPGYFEYLKSKITGICENMTEEEIESAKSEDLENDIAENITEDIEEKLENIIDNTAKKKKKKTEE